MLRYKASARKSGESAARLDAYRGARGVGEFFDIHPGPAAAARKDLGWHLSNGLCSTPGYTASPST